MDRSAEECQSGRSAAAQANAVRLWDVPASHRVPRRTAEVGADEGGEFASGPFDRHACRRLRDSSVDGAFLVYLGLTSPGYRLSSLSRLGKLRAILIFIDDLTTGNPGHRQALPWIRPHRQRQCEL
jgi:hypothetical protein